MRRTLIDVFIRQSNITKVLSKYVDRAATRELEQKGQRARARG